METLTVILAFSAVQQVTHIYTFETKHIYHLIAVMDHESLYCLAGVSMQGLAESVIKEVPTPQKLRGSSKIMWLLAELALALYRAHGSLLLQGQQGRPKPLKELPTD